MDFVIGAVLIAIIICVGIAVSFYIVNKFYPEAEDVECKIIKRYKLKDER